MNELRKQFMVPYTSPIKSAIAYTSGLGCYEFYLNRNKVDPSRKLNLGWTSYEQRTLFASSDLTANITAGIIFFCQNRNDRPNWTRAGFNDSLSAWIIPELMPPSLNSSRNGSLVLQDMLPIRVGSDALHFKVMTDSQQQGYLSLKEIDEIKGTKLTDCETLKSVAMWASDAGVSTFDLGQNIAGWCRLRFRG
ncbi:unnamed protein product [Rotaria sp. Silwood2]|nr:unnamed protein product [Rotaria sp. Silwood2]CAF2921343.1 unnamed protein product [Rotaria sp. Silwood2]CAF3177346.1 unnamed protein product [Rotaria sp. Silwood2]CAF3300087.1 unnamed protein product [Rotaria sp. Silwood2]CAF4173733.1 unnamed protein product [Rotaria sp. Silwood2]